MLRSIGAIAVFTTAYAAMTIALWQLSPRYRVNRRPILTPYRRPILTPLGHGFWR
jgi:hypothetical protein